jgi:ATP-dependent phosphofructokinase / diphosphate-dependent phosphofructokinase
MATKRIGILTGGGDVPGLNSVIKSVVYRGAELGCEVIGIRRGWEGLTHVDLNEPASKAQYILPLNRENTRTIDRTGGTFLHSSRTNPTKMRNLPSVLQDQKFEAKEFDHQGRDQHHVQCDNGGAEEHRHAGSRLADRDWRWRKPSPA